MPFCEESSSSGMEFCEDDIKIEEVSVEDELDYCDSLSDSGSVASKSSQNNMIFTRIYVPQDGRGMVVPSSVMEYKNRPGRKQKLEHLSFEEKLLRKKLKNREAAQTSRDRKKARMTDLELQVRYLQEQNERLRLEKEEACKETERLKQELVTKATSAPTPSSLTSATKLPSPADECCSSATQIAARQGSARRVCSSEATKRAAPSSNGSVAGQESAEFLELSPQKTTGPATAGMQEATRSVVSAAILHNVGQEVLVMMTTVASLLLTILLTQVSPLSPGQTVLTGTGCLTLTRAHLKSAFNSLNSSQRAYLSQLLLIIAKELKQAPGSWGPEEADWRPVQFLHANVPLFLQYLPPLPPPSLPPVQSSPPHRPSLSDIIEVSMRKVPVPPC